MSRYKGRRHSSPTRPSLCLEQLEQRCLLTGTPSGLSALSLVASPLLPPVSVEPIGRPVLLLHPPSSNLADTGMRQAPDAPELPDLAASAGFLPDPAHEIRSIADAPALAGPEVGDSGSLGTPRLLEAPRSRSWDADPVLDVRVVDLYFAAPRDPRADVFMPPADVAADHGPPPRMDAMPANGRLRDAAGVPGVEPQTEATAPLASGPASAIAALDKSPVQPPTALESTRSATLLAPRIIPASTEPDVDVAVAAVQEPDAEAGVADSPAPSHASGKLTVAVEVLAAVAPTAAPIAGLLPLDVQTLARNADRFFARLEAVGKSWSTPRLTLEIALLSAALAAGAYQLAHVRGKRTACPSFADDGEVSSLIVPVDGERS